MSWNLSATTKPYSPYNRYRSNGLLMNEDRIKMNRNFFKPITFLTAAIATAGYFAASPAAAQQTEAINSGLYANEAYIRACRETNTAVQVYDNSDLAPVTNRIGTLPTNTEVTLTGVLAPGTAQVYVEGGGLSDIQPVGWIDAAALGPCDTTAETPPTTAQACFAADVNLNVRSQPIASSEWLGTYGAGDVIYATAKPPIQRKSPNYGRIWMEVDYQGQEGWVAQTGRYGTNSNVTPITCP